MKKWKLHTVDGTGDILPAACATKYEVEERVLSVFRRFSYRAVETPVLQFYDSFEDSRIPEETMFKFFDKEGRILVLRPDITTPIARIMATKLGDQLPQRLYYSGKVFRYGKGQHEFTQAGVELYGAEGALADAEVVACGIEALRAAGLTEFQVELGQTAFFRSILAQCGLEGEACEPLRRYIDRKDALAAAEWLRDKDVPDRLKQLITELPSYFGGPEVLRQIDRTLLDQEAQDALSYLQEVYDLLVAYGFGDVISIDLSQVGELDYYTGITCKGFTHGMGFAICGGGRYDALAAGFGAAIPAVGLGIDTDRLVTALSRQGGIPASCVPDVLAYGCGDPAADYAAIAALRAQDLSVEQYLGGGSYEDATAYAKARGIGVVARLEKDGSATLHDLEKGAFYKQAHVESTYTDYDEDEE